MTGLTTAWKTTRVSCSGPKGHGGVCKPGARTRRKHCNQFASRGSSHSSGIPASRSRRNRFLRTIRGFDTPRYWVAFKRVRLEKRSSPLGLPASASSAASGRRGRDCDARAATLPMASSGTRPTVPNAIASSHSTRTSRDASVRTRLRFWELGNWSLARRASSRRS